MLHNGSKTKHFIKVNHTSILKLYSVALLLQLLSLVFPGTLKIAIRFCLGENRLPFKAKSRIHNKKGHPFSEYSVELTLKLLMTQ